MTDLDYHKLFELILDELLVRADEDISRFTYTDNDSEDDRDIFMLFRKTDESRERSIVWDTSVKKDGDEELTFTFNSTERTMSVEMPYEDSRTELDVGWGTEHGSLKMKFMRLYHLVEEYVDVELEEENLGKFYDSVQQTFPTIMDKFILEISDDEKDEKDEE